MGIFSAVLRDVTHDINKGGVPSHWDTPAFNFEVHFPSSPILSEKYITLIPQEIQLRIVEVDPERFNFQDLPVHFFVIPENGALSPIIVTQNDEKVFVKDPREQKHLEGEVLRRYPEDSDGHPNYWINLVLQQLNGKQFESEIHPLNEGFNAHEFLEGGPIEEAAEKDRVERALGGIEQELSAILENGHTD